MHMRYTGLKLLMSLIALGACIGALAQEPQRGGILQFGIVAEPPTYDCHATGTFAVLHRVAPHYSTLLKYEQYKYPNIVGDLAESWTVSPDQMTFTFKLRPNIKFHDGSKLTSEDVKASYERIMSPPPGVVSDRGGLFRNVAKVETPDARTIVFRMKQVDLSIMESGFASPWNCIYSAAKLRADPNFPARNVMGTGPFKVTKAGVDTDVPADQGLKRCANVPDNAARTDDDAADYSQMPGNTIAVESESSCAKKRLHAAGGFISNQGQTRRFSRGSTCAYGGAPIDLRILGEGNAEKF